MNKFLRFLLITSSLLAGGHAFSQCDVTSLLDDQSGGTLRETIWSCPAGNTITFSVAGTIQMIDQGGWAAMEIEKQLTIDGGNNITLSGDANFSFFSIVGRGFGGGNGSGSVIRNLEIENAKVGIEIIQGVTAPTPVNVTSATVDNVTLNNNVEHGIYADNASNLTISDVTSTNNGWHGIQMNSVSTSTLTNFTANGNGWNGVYAENSTTINLTGSTIQDNLNHGIQFVSATGGSISNNTSSGNAYDGVIVETSSTVSVTDNMLINNGSAATPNDEGRAMYVGFSTGLTVSGNTMSGNFHYGMLATEILNSTIDDNIITDNGKGGGTDKHGVSINNASNGNTISNNQIFDNLSPDASGISVEGSSNNTISGNTVNNNDNIGIIIQDNSSDNSILNNTVTNQGNDAGVQINPNSGTVSNTTISGNTIDGNLFGIQVLSGGVISVLDIENNDITNNLSDGAQILSDLSNIKFNDNNVLNNGGYGANIVSDNANAGTSEIQGNRIENNGFTDTNSPGIKDGIVVNNINGLTIGGAGASANIIVNNANHGLNLQNGQDITVDLNYIGVEAGVAKPNVDGNGLLISGVTNAVVQNTEIKGNGLSGVYVDGGSTFTINNNDLGGIDGIVNDEFGIQIQDGSGTITNNDIYANLSGGIIVASGTVNISQNNIGNVGVASPNTGVTITGGTVTVDDNTIQNFEAQGVQISGGANTVSNNNVLNNDAIGVLLDGSVNVVTANNVTGNTVTGNGLHGVQITGGQATLNTIDGNTISGNTLSGVSLEGNTSGNTVGSATANTISSNTEHGIYISGATTEDNTIENNVIEGNTLSGINVNIAGANTIQTNTIGGNSEHGIYVENTNDIQILNNKIGTDVLGTTANGNTLTGVTLQGITGVGTLVSGNTIAGNTGDGIFVGASTGGISIMNNTIGSEASATLANSDGIELSSSTLVTIDGNTIAGNNVQGVNVNNSNSNTLTSNTIGANTENGVYISGTSGDNVLESNYIGIKPDNSDFPNGAGKAGVQVAGGANNTIGTTGNPNFFGGSTQDFGVLVDGGTATIIESNEFGLVNSTTLNGVKVSGGTVASVSQNVFGYPTKVAVSIDGATVTSVNSNYFGVENDGVTPLTDKPETAIEYVNGSLLSTFDQNVIAGTTGDAIKIEGAATSRITIDNNKVGLLQTEADGTGLTGNGVFIDGAAQTSITNNVIGLATMNGISVNNVSSATITGNRIGVKTDDSDAGITGAGIFSDASTGLDISGGNIIGNNAKGIHLSNGSVGVIDGNQIGVAGTTLIGNTEEGIFIEDGTFGNQVLNNIIGGNTDGIKLSNSDQVSLTNNFIGTDAALSTNNLANGTGISIDGGSDRSSISTNTIAYSSTVGVHVTGAGSDRNLLTQNSMYCNAAGGVPVGADPVGTGIELSVSGNNTGNDADFMGQAFTTYQPQIFSNSLDNKFYLELRTDSLIAKGFTEAPTGSHVVEVFSVDDECTNCQGKEYLGNMVLGTNGFEFNLTDEGLSESDVFVVTVRRSDNNTSHFSACSKGVLCNVPDSVVVSEINLGVEELAKVCDGTIVDLEGVTYKGGSATAPGNVGDYNYYWSVAGVEGTNTTNEFNGITAIQNQVYTIQAYAITDDANPIKFKDYPGCFVEDTIQVIINELPEFTLSTGADYCNGGSTTVTVTMTTGDLPYTFDWDDNGTNQGTIISDSLKSDTTFNYGPANITAATVNHVIDLSSLTDSNQCAATDLTPTDNFDVFPTPDATIALNGASNSPMCPGSSADLDVTLVTDNLTSVTIYYVADTVVGGTSLVLSESANATPHTFTVTPDRDVNYVLDSIVDGNNCSVAITGQDELIELFPEVTGGWVDGDVICAGGSTTIDMEFSASTKTSASVAVPYPLSVVYDSVNTGGTTTVTENPVNATPLTVAVDVPSGTTTFNLTSITDVNTCVVNTGFDKASVEVTVNPVPTPTITGLSSHCIYEAPKASVTNTVGNSYLWSVVTGGASYSINTPSAASTELDLTGFTATDGASIRVVETVGTGATACTGEDTQLFTINDTVSFAITFDEACEGIATFDTDTMTNWTLATFEGSAIATPPTTGTYTTTYSPANHNPTTDTDVDVTVTVEVDATGCTNSNTGTIVVNPKPVIGGLAGFGSNCETVTQTTVSANTGSVVSTLSFVLDPLSNNDLTDNTDGTALFETNSTTTPTEDNDITINATSNKGCVADPVIGTINVEEATVIDFSVKQLEPQCEGISSNQSYEAIVDPADEVFVTKYKWYVNSTANKIPSEEKSIAYPTVQDDNILLEIDIDPTACKKAPFPNQKVVSTVTVGKPVNINLSGESICIDDELNLTLSYDKDGGDQNFSDDLNTWYLNNVEIQENEYTYSEEGRVLGAGDHTFKVEVTATATTDNPADLDGNIDNRTGTCTGEGTDFFSVIDASIVAYANGSNSETSIRSGNGVALTSDPSGLSSKYDNYVWTLESAIEDEDEVSIGEQIATTQNTDVFIDKSTTYSSVTYHVAAEYVINPNSTCEVFDTVSVNIFRECFVPNGFTPNNDSYNDTWDIDCIQDRGEYPNATVKVYNRWGELIYKDEAGYREPWDGTRNGTLVPIGTYYFVIDLNFDETDEPIAGAVAIMK